MRTQEEKRRISVSCRASVRRRKRLGRVPGRANSLEKERERARKISEARKGMTFTEEHRKKLSLAKVGRKLSKATKAKMSTAHKRRLRLVAKDLKACQMCGSKQHSTMGHHKRCTTAQVKNDVIRKQKYGTKRPQLCKPRPDMVGERNWRWKGGGVYRHSSNHTWRRLRSLVLARDKKTCQQCGKTNQEVRIVVHHIDHSPQHDWLDNLITLCHPDNVRAESKKYKEAWEKKFKQYTKTFVYQIE